MTTENVQVETPETQGTPAPEAGTTQPPDEEQPDAQADTEQEGEEEERKDPPQETPEEYSKRVQKRIDKEVWRARQAEQKAAELEERLAALEKLSAPKPAEKPKLEDFDTQEEYVEALTDWKLEQRLSEREQKRDEADQTTKAKAKVEELQKAFSTREEEFRAKTPDYDDVWPNFIVPKTSTGVAVANFVAGSEYGPELIYKLGKDVDLAGTLFAMPPEYAVRKLESLAGSLKAPPSQPQKLPDPPKALKGTPATGKSLDRMTPAEILALARK